MRSARLVASFLALLAMAVTASASCECPQCPERTSHGHFESAASTPPCCGHPEPPVQPACRCFHHEVDFEIYIPAAATPPPLPAFVALPAPEPFALNAHLPGPFPRWRNDPLWLRHLVLLI